MTKKPIDTFVVRLMEISCPAFPLKENSVLYLHMCPGLTVNTVRGKE
ncbi:MAG TPA: hypothetical protein VEG61_00830 [Candidatus Dormibacteraeota bacterium]|nr:hypothetical protein [Candidatus Dormibacteraeota bacterium]